METRDDMDENHPQSRLLTPLGDPSIPLSLVPDGAGTLTGCARTGVGTLKERESLRVPWDKQLFFLLKFPLDQHQSQ
jgi:hypothetical protein